MKSIIDELRENKYTGENRCLPCTVVNIGIALLSTAVVTAALRTKTTTRNALAAGGAFLSLSTALIWLRGYLVPKTPELTKRYLPPQILALFGKTGNESDLVVVDGIDGEEIEQLLLDTGVIEPCADGDDLCLSEEFGDQWQMVVTEQEPDIQRALATFGFDSDTVTVEEYDDAAIIKQNGEEIGRWPSRLALRADAATVRLLSDRIDGWKSFLPAERSKIASSVRLFLDECPNGEEANFTETTIESCCSEQDVAAVICAESETPLYETPIQS